MSKKKYTKKLKREQAQRILGHDKNYELAKLLYECQETKRFEHLKEYIDFE